MTLIDRNGPSISSTLPDRHARSTSDGVILATSALSPSTSFARRSFKDTATFGGFTPAVSQYLYHLTDNRAVAGIWLMFAAACDLAAALVAWRPEFRARQVAAAE